MKVLFLVPYPQKVAPSQRFRFEQYYGVLTKAGISYSVHNFTNLRLWSIQYKKGNFPEKAIAMLTGLLRRASLLFSVSRFDIIFIHREAAPIGPPIIEWILVKIMNRKVIYDFDDAIWLTDNKEEGKIEKIIRWRTKVNQLCKWAQVVSVGNEYLASYARSFNPNVVLNPTTIDTERWHNLSVHSTKTRTIVGWTGSHSTLKYLNDIVPVMINLEKKYPLQFLVIADKRPDFTFQSLHFHPWSAESEISDLSQIDIGVMPLPDDEWTQGKCGFKLLQYMALEIPAIASPVGINTHLIDESKAGFLCSTPQEWTESMEQLICDENLRTSMGKNGRRFVQQHYSLTSNSDTFLSLFK